MSYPYDLTQLCSYFYKAAKSRENRVLLIGDSLAVGLNNQLRQHAQDAGMLYQGKGVGSKTIWYWVNGEGRQWLNNQLASFRPTHVFISLGTNDAYTRMSSEQIAKLTRELNDIIRQAGASPMWIGAPTLPDRSGGVSIKRDLLDTIRGNAGHLFDTRKVNLPQVDKIHPTAKGYGLWADEVWHWALTGSQRTVSKAVPRADLTPMKNSEVTPALSQIAVQILRKYRNEPVGTRISFTQGGKKYVAKISNHPPNSLNPKWHKGVDLHYPAGTVPTTRTQRTTKRTYGLTPELRYKLEQIAKDVGIDPNWLATVISFESGFSPRAVNPKSYATGLIQWMPFNIHRLYKVPAKRTHPRMTKQEKIEASEWMKNKSAMEQMDMVKSWFSKYKGRLRSLEDVYLAVFMPSLIRKSPNTVVARKGNPIYDQNSGFDRDKKGYFTRRDVTATIRGHKGTGAQARREERKSTLQQILDYLLS